MEKFKITFYPDNKTVEVEKGVTVLSAAISAGLQINSSCGGDGVCGRCKVILNKGGVVSLPTGRITAEEKKKGILESAQAEAERTIATAKAMGESERKRIIGQSKGDILDLAFAAAAAALGKKITEQEDKKFTERIIKEL